MHGRRGARLAPLLVALVLVVGAAWWWRGAQASAAGGSLRASGTIEAREVVVAAEVMARVLSVEAEAGDAVTAGEPLVRLDPALLQAQRAQAEAGLSAVMAQADAARAALGAAEANLDLLRAGPSEAQLGVAEGAVEQAEAALSVAEASNDALPDAAQVTQGMALQRQVELARATLRSAQAQLRQIEEGARPEQLVVAKHQVEMASGQAEAAEAQTEAGRAALGALDVQLARWELVAPVDGIILTRAVEPGEVARPGGALLVLANLTDLTLTVYVTEDRYGTIRIGDEATVRVDSFPGRAFRATVRRIADRAEFTPRNVQTVEGRKSTVFAVELRVNNADSSLKPGMPADVTFEQGEG